MRGVRERGSSVEREREREGNESRPSRTVQSPAGSGSSSGARGATRALAPFQVFKLLLLLWLFSRWGGHEHVHRADLYKFHLKRSEPIGVSSFFLI